MKKMNKQTLPTGRQAILITGGAGFIGSHLVDRLIQEGYKVVIVDNLSSGKRKNLNPRAKFYKVDIRNKKALANVFQKEKPRDIFHLAAQINLRKSVDDPVEDAKINILGGLNLVQCFLQSNPLPARREGAKFIFSSTGGAIYGEAEVIPTSEKFPARPMSPYGIAKLSFEHYLDYYQKVFGLDFVSLRYANVYGPRQNSKGEAGVVAIFCDQILSGNKPVIYGNGQQTRDYVFVDDVVEANILSLQKNVKGVFNIGTGKETSVNQLFQKINKIFDGKIRRKHGPAKKGEQKRSCLDCQKAKKILGWENKVELDEGLKRTVEWFKNGK
jgi:UDP-glucose 4-epimerase